MSEMIERMARAMAERAGRSYAVGREVFDQAARAALEAMREPTWQMTAAAPTGITSTTSLSGGCDPREVWRAMIDQALKDE